MELENVQSVLSMVRVGGLVTAALLLAGTYAVSRLITVTLTRLGERITERRLLFQQVASFARFGVYFIGVFLALITAVELRQETVLALSGTAGVALGFAFKDLASSVLAGLTILIDKPFQVGDRVNVNGTYGDVVSIGLRSVRIVTLDDNLVTIPNNRFLSEAVASGNAGELNMLVQMDFYVGIDQDIDRAKRLAEEAITTSRYAFLDKPWTVLVSQVLEDGYFAVRLRAKAYVNDTHYEKEFETDVNLRLMRAFQREGIEPPARLNRSVDARPRKQVA